MSETSGSPETPATPLHWGVWKRGKLAVIEDLGTKHYCHVDPPTSSPSTEPVTVESPIDRCREIGHDYEQRITHSVALASTATGTVISTDPRIVEGVAVSEADLTSVVDTGGIADRSAIWDLSTMLTLSMYSTTHHRP